MPKTKFIIELEIEGDPGEAETFIECLQENGVFEEELEDHNEALDAATEELKLLNVKTRRADPDGDDDDDDGGDEED